MKLLIKSNDTEKFKQIIDEIIKIATPWISEVYISEGNLQKDTVFVKECDIIITVGGDGTLLGTSPLAIKYNKPILGINVGRLGFLTAIEGNQLEELKKFFETPETFEIKKHSLLKAKINNGAWHYCLNDVVVAKNMFSNTISTQVYSNDICIAKIICDSLILATATGSTAYSLSAGGPIVDSDLQALIISPVAVHSLNATPMVLAKDKKITIGFDASRQQEIYISFDGNDHKKIKETDIVQVQVASKFLKIYTAKNMGQFAKVDQKIKLR